MDILIQENPTKKRNLIGYDRNGKPIYLSANPVRSKKRRKNPVAATKAMKQYTQGIGATEVVAGALGVAGAGVFPGMVIKTAETGTQKFMKILVAVMSTIAVGWVAKSTSGAAAGKAAVIGGLSATALQAVTVTTGVTIGGQNQIAAGRMRRQIGVPQMVSPPQSRQDETVSLITP